MRRGAVIHGVLLVAALLFAYQTWTREEVVAPLTGDVVVWAIPAETIQAITLEARTIEAEGRTIRVERRSDAEGPYLWGSDTRTIERYQPRAKDAPDAAPGDERPYAPEKASTTREFMVGEKGDELLENLAELRALRSLGKIDEDKRELYELHDKTQTVSVIHAGGTRSLVIGGKVFGGSDRYALDPSTGEVYVISQVVTGDLARGEAGLRLADIHAWEDEELGKAIIEANGQKRTLIRTTTTDDSGREIMTWADAQTPDRPDQTMANLVRNIGTMRPARFVPEADPARLPRVLRVEYQTRVGAPLGWVELYAQEIGAGDEAGSDEAARQDKRRVVYLMRTEVMRVLAGVPHTMATRIIGDLEQIFGQ